MRATSSPRSRTTTSEATKSTARRCSACGRRTSGSSSTMASSPGLAPVLWGLGALLCRG
jgi:hypothetical protein